MEPKLTMDQVIDEAGRQLNAVSVALHQPGATMTIEQALDQLGEAIEALVTGNGYTMEQYERALLARI